MSLLEEKDAIRDLYGKYALFYDSGRYDDFMTLFAEDAVLDSTEIGGSLTIGKEAIRESLGSADNPDKTEFHCRHFLLNYSITVEEDLASAHTYYLFMVPDNNDEPAIGGIGQYDDIFIKTGGQWFFKHHRLLRAFR